MYFHLLAVPSFSQFHGEALRPFVAFVVLLWCGLLFVFCLVCFGLFLWFVVLHGLLKASPSIGGARTDPAVEEL